MAPADPPRTRVAWRAGVLLLIALLPADQERAQRMNPPPLGHRPGPRPPGGVWVNRGHYPSVGGSIPAILSGHIEDAPRPEHRAHFWAVHTRNCPQVMGSDPWPCLQVLQFDEAGRLIPRDPGMLLVQAAQRPVLIVLHGNQIDLPTAISGGIWAHDSLEALGALPREAVVVSFHWPSEQIDANPVRDVNEKARRSYVAASHLARFVPAFPPGSRICLLGHSYYGGTAITAALHVLGGGRLDS